MMNFCSIIVFEMLGFILDNIGPADVVLVPRIPIANYVPYNMNIGEHGGVIEIYRRNNSSSIICNKIQIRPAVKKRLFERHVNLFPTLMFYFFERFTNS